MVKDMYVRANANKLNFKPKLNNNEKLANQIETLFDCLFTYE